MNFLDLIQCFNPALDLCGFGGVGAEAVDESLLLCQHGLLPGESGLLIGGANVALAFVEIIVAGVSDDLASIYLSDPGYKPVHKFAVMRCHQQSALK